MYKNTVEPDWPERTIRRMHISYWIPKAADTHTDYVTVFVFFCTATIVTRTLLNITLYVHYRSCMFLIPRINSDCLVLTFTFTFFDNDFTRVIWRAFTSTSPLLSVFRKRFRSYLLPSTGENTNPRQRPTQINPLEPELNPICYLLALLGAHHFLHVSKIRVKLLTLRWLMSYIYGVPILDVSRSHTTTQHSR